MLASFLRTAAKAAVASLIVGTILAHFGITADALMREAGLSQERIVAFFEKGMSWALPNLTLGALVILPLWFLAMIFRPSPPSRD